MKGVVFDWDGTLADIDEREQYCISGALQAHGAKPIGREFYIQNYYLRPYEVGSGPRMVLEAALHDDNRVEQAYETYRRLFGDNVDKAKLQRGALELLQALKKQRLKIGIATMRFTRSVVASELKSLKVDPYADILLTREDLGFGKRLGSLRETVDQRVKLVTKVLEKLGISPGDSPLVGDSWWDIRAGKQLGMKTILVLTGFSSYNDFSGERPDLTVKTLLELGPKLQSGEW